MRMFAGLDVGFSGHRFASSTQTGKIVWRGVVDTHPEMIARRCIGGAVSLRR